MKLEMMTVLTIFMGVPVFEQTTRQKWIFPVLAGFQSEHAVEIPLMLTTEENSENHSAGPKKAADWRGSGLF